MTEGGMGRGQGVDPIATLTVHLAQGAMPQQYTFVNNYVKNTAKMPLQCI